MSTNLYLFIKRRHFTMKEKENSQQSEISPFDKLKDRQKLFVLEYLKDFNATQAAIRAGYSKKTAAVIASENLTKLNIKSAVEQKAGEIMEDKQETLLQIRRELERVGFADIKEFIDFKKGNIKLNIDNESDTRSIESVQIDNTLVAGTGKKGKARLLNQTVRFKMHSKLKALEQLGQLLGIVSDQSGGNVFVYTINPDFMPKLNNGSESDKS